MKNVLTCNNRFILILILVFLLTVLYFYYSNYVQTIKIFLPVVGEVDTGITQQQLKKFKEAQIEYDNMRSNLYAKLQTGSIDNKMYSEQKLQIGYKYFSDNRITAITSGPAKKFINYLLK